MESHSIPKSITVFGILHTAFGSLGLVTGLSGLIKLDKTLSIFEQSGLSSSLIGWLRVSSYLSPVLSAILLVLGIGLLMKKPWARSGAVTFAYVSIALALVSAVMSAIGFMGMSSAKPEGSAIAVGAMIGGIVGAVVGSIYPILTIVFLNQQSVKAALDQRGN